MVDSDQLLRDVIGQEVWAEYFIVELDQAVLAAGTGNAFTDVSLRMDSDAPFAIQSRTFVATSSDIYLMLQDTDKGRYLTNGRRHLRTLAGQPVAGSGVGLSTSESLFSPMPLLSPYVISPSSVFTLSMADNANSGNNALFFAMHGAKIRKGRAPWDKDWKERYQFSAGMTGPTVVVPANGVGMGVIQIGQDADFLVRSISGTRTSGSLVVRVSDGAHDKVWSASNSAQTERAVRIDNFMGNAGSPNILPSPKFIERGTSVILYFVDTSGSANTVEVTMHGEKLLER